MSETVEFAEERRLGNRIYGIYTLLVRAKNAEGHEITSRTVADDVCSGGLYFQLPRLLPAGASIFTILRTQSRTNGVTGMAMRFSLTRILQLPHR